MKPARGAFITLEGCEGCGKTTQSDPLVAWLVSLGKSVVTTREPGGTPTGEMIRDLLQHHASGEDISPPAEVLLFAASRAQHVAHVIRPALERGDWVVCDRFVDSSLAYQAGGRGIGLDRVLAINEYALDGCWPDCTLWFDLPVETALARMAVRGARPDRFESEQLGFHQRVGEAYAGLAKRFPERFRRVDAARGVVEVSADVRSRIRDRLGEWL